MAADGGFTMVDSLTGRLATLGAGGVASARAVMESMADDIRQYAQENAPWGDRTGAARAGLDTAVSQEGNDLYLELFHTVEHGEWLEVIQSGRFAIIMPTLEAFAGELFAKTGAAFLGEE